MDADKQPAERPPEQLIPAQPGPMTTEDDDGFDDFDLAWFEKGDRGGRKTVKSSSRSELSRLLSII